MRSISPLGHVDNFALLDQYGTLHELYYHSNASAIVFISQGNGCPILRKQLGAIQQLRAEFEPKGVVFLMINPNPQDDRASIIAEANAFEIDLPILEDKPQMVSQSLHIVRSAQAVIVNPKSWNIVYSGAINDQFGYETQKHRPGQNYVRDALKSLLAHQIPSINQTTTAGCLISYESRKGQDQINYVRDIAPVLINKCLNCHSPQGIAPWHMNRYETIKGWGAMIKEVIQVKRMPPWGADTQHKEVKQGTPLEDEQVRILLQWLKEGMVRGEGEDPLLQHQPLAQEWPMGPPDLILNLEQAQQIPATGQVIYRDVKAKETVEQDQWIKAIYWKPGNRKIIHHATLYASNPNQLEHPEWFYGSGLYTKDKNNSIKNEKDMIHLFDTFVPGQQPMTAPEQTGLYVPKGTTFAFQFHYTPTGKKEDDNTKVGLYFHKEQPPHVLALKFSYNHDVKIPPLEKEYVLSSTYTFRNNGLLYAIRPHMHARGRKVWYDLIYPDGKTETILSVPHYRYLWQFRYVFQEPIKITKGTRIIAQGMYDNSAQNPDNPDPQQWVTYGMQADNEMLGSMYYYSDLPQ